MTFEGGISLVASRQRWNNNIEMPVKNEARKCRLDSSGK